VLFSLLSYSLIPCSCYVTYIIIHVNKIEGNDSCLVDWNWWEHKHVCVWCAGMEAVTQRSHPDALTAKFALVLVLWTQNTLQSAWIIDTYVDTSARHIISLKSMMPYSDRLGGRTSPLQDPVGRSVGLSGRWAYIRVEDHHSPRSARCIWLSLLAGRDTQVLSWRNSIA
jgi:hypothetical protein